MTKATWGAAILAVMVAVACSAPKRPEPSAPIPAASTAGGALSADAIHRSAIVIDTHNDVTQRLVLEDADLSRPFPDAQTDIPRMQAGGLDAEFLSVWVPPQLYPGDKAYAQSIAEFDAIDRFVSRTVGVAVLARGVSDVLALPPRTRSRS